jgi:phage tail-like protein
MAPTSSTPKLTPACYFLIQIAGIDTIGAFMTCHGLSIEYDVLQYMEGGNNDFAYSLPGHTKYSNLVFTRGLTDQDNLMTWLKKTETEPDLKDITVTFQDSTKKALRTWTFQEAFPIRWQGPSFDANSNSIATEELEIAHSGLKPA